MTPTENNFIYTFYLDDLSICDSLIEHFKKSNSKNIGVTSAGEGKGLKDSIDLEIDPSDQNPLIQKYIRYHIYNALKDYYKIYSKLCGDVRVEEKFNIQYYLPKGGYFAWHNERSSHRNRALVFMTYLNDVTDGGETEWFYQDVKIQPKKGLSVIWPTDFTHTHRGVVSPTQEKYIITGWLNFLNG